MISLSITRDEFNRLPSESPQKSEEERVRNAMSQFLAAPLRKLKLKIFCREKEFDLVNVKAMIVGDVKSYSASSYEPSGKKATISECVWLMEKLEASTKCKWRKIIAGSGDFSFFKEYANNYGMWLGDVEMYFVDISGKVDKTR